MFADTAVSVQLPNLQVTLGTGAKWKQPMNIEAQLQSCMQAPRNRTRASELWCDQRWAQVTSRVSGDLAAEIRELDAQRTLLNAATWPNTRLLDYPKCTGLHAIVPKSGLMLLREEPSPAAERTAPPPVRILHAIPSARCLDDVGPFKELCPAPCKTLVSAA